MRRKDDGLADDEVNSARLCEEIRKEVVRRGGWLGFDAFMELALYAPGLGYYRTDGVKFGRGGDFVTAPGLGGGLARCLARQGAEVLGELGGGDVLEFGGGDGSLAVDFLREMGGLGVLPRRYVILEVSGALRERQRERVRNAGLGEVAGRVEWAGDLGEVCAAGEFGGLVVANEVLDAMPVVRFEVVGGRAMELGVGVDEEGGGFCWRVGEGELGAGLQGRLGELGVLGWEGYRSEVGVRAEGWVRSVGEWMGRGVLLILDYGFAAGEFYHRQRREGTLMGHFRHRAHGDVFFAPGAQDISAHVDFSAVAAAGREVGLEVGGYTSQGAFLLGLGVLEDVEGGALQDAREVGVLTMPHEMGELVKVLGLTKGYAAGMRGFGLYDRAGRL